MIKFDPVKLNLFTDFYQTTDSMDNATKVVTKGPKTYPFRFNQKNLEEIYKESFDRSSPLFIYKDGKNVFASSLNIEGLTLQDKQEKYKEFFMALSKNVENPFILDELNDNPTYEKFKNVLYVERFVNCCTVLLDDLVQPLFSKNINQPSVFEVFIIDKCIDKIAPNYSGKTLSSPSDTLSGQMCKSSVVNRKRTSCYRTGQTNLFYSTIVHT
jgi:hypothetical protein